MANNVNEDGALYISILSTNGTAYTIKDAWARAEIAEIEQAIAGGVHFRGVTTTAIADGDALKALTVGSETIPTTDQNDGDLFIYNNGTQNLEFVVSNGHYSELGSTGSLGALAFADTASGSVTVPIASAITFNTYTPDVSKGTLAVTTSNDTIEVTSTADTASGTFSPAAITIAASSVTLTPTTGTYTALSDVTYDSSTATLSLTSVTSDAFWKSATGEAAGQTVTPDADQSISVSYQKVTPVAAKTFLTASSLTGDLTVTGAAPTATITDPSITVTVTPDAD